MMDSTNDDDFGANPFRMDGGVQPDMFAPVPQQQPQFAQPPPLQQQQQPQFAQPPSMQQPQQQFEQQSFQPQQQFEQQSFQPQMPAAPVNPNMPAGLMSPLPEPTMPNQPHLPAQQAQPLTLWGNCMACLTFDSYKQYFDIDADDIVTRVRGVFLHFYKPEHFRNNVMGPMKTNELKGPDLYGPFWITMTLIFFIGVTANIHSYVHRNDVEEFDYDINHLLHAASILVTFAFGLPLVLWMTTTCCMSMNTLQLAEWLCLYGYSLVPYMPAVVLSILPFSIIAWVTLALATVTSGLMVIRNVAPSLMSADTSGTGNGIGGQSKGPPIVLAILGCHLVFFLVLKFTFYHFSPHKHTQAPTLFPTLAPVASPEAAPAAAPNV